MAHGKSHDVPFEAEAGRQGAVVTPLLPYGVGIDTHRDFIQVCVLVQQSGEVLRFEKEFPTTWAWMKEARLWAMGHAKVPLGTLQDVNFRYTIESTGTYHVPVLLSWRGKPSVVNPVLAGPTRRKTDTLDARMLAHHSLVGMWPESFIPERYAESFRILLNMRSEASRNATRALNRVNNHLLRFGHTLGRECSMADLMARGSVEDMCNGVVPALPTVCPEGIPEPVRCFFTDAYKMYDQMCDIRDEYEDKATAFLKATEWPILEGDMNGWELLNYLKTVPGVGTVSALTWLSVVCDPKRFQHSKQVAAFCGADPSLKVSAGKVTSHIKRKGNAKLHHVLKNAAARLVRLRKEPLGLWGFALQRRHAKGGWARAINAVSRRLAVFMWQVHLRGESFSYDKYRFFEVPNVKDVTVEAMELGSRYTKLLVEAGLTRSNEIARAFQTSLPQQKGIGAGCLGKVKAWLEGNREPGVQPKEPPAVKEPRRNPLAVIPTGTESSSVVSLSVVAERCSPSAMEALAKRTSSSRTSSASKGVGSKSPRTTRKTTSTSVTRSKKR